MRERGGITRDFLASTSTSSVGRKEVSGQSSRESEKLSQKDPAGQNIGGRRSNRGGLFCETPSPYPLNFKEILRGESLAA